MFSKSVFNGDISNWNVSNVTNMSRVFSYSKFNGDISNWDVSNVREMSAMFRDSVFNGDISNWSVSNVTNMHSMFSKSVFNGDISNWDVSNVTNMSYMFNNSIFNGDISNWNFINDHIRSHIPKRILKEQYLYEKLSFHKDSIFNDTCPICESIEKLVVNKCKHVICHLCYTSFKDNNIHKCPLCRLTIDIIAKIF